MKEQIKEMMSIQNELNCQLNPDWQKARWNFLLAANIEMVEAIEHYGWKWWKHQEPDIEQVKMEMADILHFILSEAIAIGYSEKDIRLFILDGFSDICCDFSDSAKKLTKKIKRNLPHFMDVVIV